MSENYHRTLEELMGADIQDVSMAEILKILKDVTSTQLLDANNLSAVVEVLEGFQKRIAALENHK